MVDSLLGIYRFKRRFEGGLSGYIEESPYIFRVIFLDNY